MPTNQKTPFNGKGFSIPDELNLKIPGINRLEEIVKKKARRIAEEQEEKIREDIERDVYLRRRVEELQRAMGWPVEMDEDGNVRRVQSAPTPAVSSVPPKAKPTKRKFGYTPRKLICPTP